MSIAAALTSLQADITAARAAVTSKGGTVTQNGGTSQLADNIGTIRAVIKETGTITPVSDSCSVTIETGLSSIKELCMFADVDDPATLSAHTILKANADRNALSSYETGASPLEQNVLCGGCVVKSSVSFSVQVIKGTFSGGTVTMEAGSSSVYFRAGRVYRWTAYGWEDTQ